MPIHFQSSVSTFRPKNVRKKSAWLQAIITSEKKVCKNISYSFVNDEELLQMNLKYLQHNTYTDIITFDYCEGKNISGDIFISIDRVKENAAKFSVNFETELNRVMAHGVLHLCGYKDKTKADIELMRRKENAALRKFSKA